MRENKGFTLIELLAVVVIMGIVMAIAITATNNIIYKIRIKHCEETGHELNKAAKIYYETNDNGNNVEYKFKFPEDLEKLPIEDADITGGQLNINDKGKVEFAVSNGMFCLKKNYDKEDIQISKNITDCILKWIARSDDPCLNNKSLKCSKGTKVEVNVSSTSKSPMIFYVIKDDGTNVTMIANQNIGNNVEWISNADYNNKNSIMMLVGVPDGIFNMGKGPITSMRYMKDITSDWDNISEKNYTISDDNNGSSMYTAFNIKSRARMITYKELEGLGCKYNYANSCPAWLTENLNTRNTYGYWSSSSNDGYHGGAWIVWKDGGIATYASYVYPEEYNTKIGIRPVIEINKNLI